jgi:hypothetical protein
MTRLTGDKSAIEEMPLQIIPLTIFATRVMRGSASALPIIND